MAAALKGKAGHLTNTIPCKGGAVTDQAPPAVGLRCSRPAPGKPPAIARPAEETCESDPCGGWNADWLSAFGKTTDSTSQQLTAANERCTYD